MTSYVEFVDKITTFPARTKIETDMAHLHKVLSDVREASGNAPLASIDHIQVVMTDDFREGVKSLVHSAIMGLAMGDGEPFSDITGSFRIARVDVDIQQYNNYPSEVEVDIYLIHNNELRKCDKFKKLVETIKCCQHKRMYC